MSWTIGRKLGAAFGAVSLLFLIALAVSLSFAGKANDRWDETLALSKAEQGASQQIRGIQAQMRAQAQLAATLDRRYEAAFEAGVEAGNEGSAAVEALQDPVVSQISSEANAADHEHDAAVVDQLFPAARRGDREAALRALAGADEAVDVILAKTLTIDEHIAIAPRCRGRRGAGRHRRRTPLRAAGRARRDLRSRPPSRCGSCAASGAGSSRSSSGCAGSARSPASCRARSTRPPAAT